MKMKSTCVVPFAGEKSVATAAIGGPLAPYLAAAAALGIEPQGSIAIEDSLNDTLSAEAAGYRWW